MSEHSPGDEVEAFVRGDAAVVDEIRAAIAQIVTRFRFSNPAQQQELTQDALTRVVVNVMGERFRRESSLKTYAQNVAKYTCLEQVRRARRQSHVDLDELPSEAAWAAPEDQLLRAEQHRSNLDAFAALSAECRKLFVLVFVDRLPYGEVARHLGVSEGALRTRVHRCRLKGRQSIARKTP